MVIRVYLSLFYELIHMMTLHSALLVFLLQA